MPHTVLNLFWICFAWPLCDSIAFTVTFNPAVRVVRTTQNVGSVMGTIGTGNLYFEEIEVFHACACGEHISTSNEIAFAAYCVALCATGGD